MLPPRQYYLTSTSPETVADGYRTESVGDWQVVFDEAYDLVPVVAGEDRVGVVVGTVLDVTEQLRDGAIHLSTANASAFEDELGRLAGRYVAVFDAGRTYAYTDPAGAVPLVYDPDEGVAASVPAALPGVDHRSRFRSGLFDRLSYDADNIWLPGRLTYYEGVRRLLPNHRLDLKSWEPERFWPRDPQVIAAETAPSTAAESIADVLRSVFAALVDRYESPVMSLTAGKDTRVLAAAARPWLRSGEVRTFTWDHGDRYDVDIDTARRIALDHRIDWSPVSVERASAADRRWWLENTGHAVGGAILDLHPTLASLDGDVQINGFGGEIGRGYYWADGDTADRSFDSTELLDRLHLPVEPPLEAAVEEWYDEVRGYDAFTRLDLMYQELRLGCWAGPHHTAMAQFRDFVGPLYHRQVVRQLYRLPPDVRRHDDFPPLLVEQLWPALNEYPYTAYGDWRDYVRTAKELRRMASVAWTRPVRAGSYLVRQLTRT